MKQNLVFIMTDQQRADTLGMTVGAETVTPNLNHLTRESTVFEMCIRDRGTLGYSAKIDACVTDGQV